jgi:hypothetical protein
MLGTKLRCYNTESRLSFVPILANLDVIQSSTQRSIANAKNALRYLSRVLFATQILVIIKLTIGLFKNALSNAVRDRGEYLLWSEVMRKCEGIIGTVNISAVSVPSVSHASITPMETPY